MTKNIADYLGSPASSILQATPFKDWPVEKSFEEEDLEEPIINYVFLRHGLELRCDRDDKISVIFLYSDEFNGFNEGLFEIPFSWGRDQVLEHFGTPSKSGGKVSDPILGNYGAWDRFTLPGRVVHFEYRANSDSIKKITLMREDMVP
jgi:hypothetical protein